MTEHLTSRRTVVTGVGLTALGLAVTGCTEYGATAAEPAAQPAGRTAGNAELAATADIPVGGGKIFEDTKLVVTQPTQGSFKCFSAVCTHQGCLVTEVAQGTINCNCHGSKFNPTDGSVVDGPANAPLPARRITITNNSIQLA